MRIPCARAFIPATASSGLSLWKITSSAAASAPRSISGCALPPKKPAAFPPIFHHLWSWLGKMGRGRRRPCRGRPTQELMQPAPRQRQCLRELVPIRAQTRIFIVLTRSLLASKPEGLMGANLREMPKAGMARILVAQPFGAAMAMRNWFLRARLQRASCDSYQGLWLELCRKRLIFEDKRALAPLAKAARDCGPRLEPWVRWLRKEIWPRTGERSVVDNIRITRSPESAHVD